MKRFLALALLLGASVLTLPGCGEEAKTEPKTETPAPTAPAEEKKADAPATPPVEEPKK